MTLQTSFENHFPECVWRVKKSFFTDCTMVRLNQLETCLPSYGLCPLPPSSVHTFELTNYVLVLLSLKQWFQIVEALGWGSRLFYQAFQVIWCRIKSENQWSVWDKDNQEGLRTSTTVLKLHSREESWFITFCQGIRGQLNPFAPTTQVFAF